MNQLERIKATFRLEGIELSEEVLDLCRKIINGETTADEEISKIKDSIMMNQDNYDKYRKLKEESCSVCIKCKNADNEYYSKPPCNYCVENGWVQVQLACTKEYQEKDGFDADKVGIFFEGKE